MADNSFDTKAVEKKWYSYWEKEGLFEANPSSTKPPYSILMPPPNLTGALHVGHALQHAILDALARFKRMRGFDVLLLPGIDHAGIQFEGTLDKKLAKEGLSKRKLGREEWLKKAWEFKDENYQSFHNTWTVIGISADWKREVFTLDEGPKKAVFEEFKSFYEQGLLYKGAYIVHWCPKCGTAIEDSEIEYEQRKEKLYYLQYGPIVIATARPETKFGDTAMAVNPKDKRYKQYIGKEFEIETLNGKKKMKVVGDEVVDPNFGTGAEKVTPGHDFKDYEIGKRHNLSIITVIDKQGRLTEVAGKYEGMKIMEAREAMLPELKEKGILVKVEDYTHSVPVCERCKTVVEPIISEEWFVKIKPLAQRAVEEITSAKIHFLPSNYAEILIRWLENIHDWCISRTLWWGHRIPVWYKGGEEKVSLSSPGEGWKQDEQVLDTWFSSGLWPMSTLGWPDKTKMEKYFPWNFEITAPEIKYLWIARMIMLSLHFKKDIPFKTMFFHGMIRDLQGRKFSKSLGNGIDPYELIDQWGADNTRMALYSYSAAGRDGRTSRQVMDQRAQNFRNFSTKLRNIYRFIFAFKPESGSTSLSFIHKDDKQIKQSLEQTITEVTKQLESFNFHLATEAIYTFTWHTFADLYIEQTKKRRAEAQPVLEYIFYKTIQLLHPFMPFLTEDLYREFIKQRPGWLNKIEKSIMLTPWPNEEP